MWLLFSEAKTWSCRPSDLLAIEDTYVAYCLDQAVAYFGCTVEAELNSVEAKTKEDAQRLRQQILERYLGTNQDKPGRGQFADPAAMMM